MYFAAELLYIKPAEPSEQPHYFSASSFLFFFFCPTTQTPSRPNKANFSILLLLLFVCNSKSKSKSNTERQCRLSALSWRLASELLSSLPESSFK